MMQATVNGQRVKQVRCAVYTRKSTEEGLDQEYNTLDAQWDACESYILSQKAVDGKRFQLIMMMAALQEQIQNAPHLID